MQCFLVIIIHILWSVDIGNIDILLGAYIMPSYVSIPRIGHLDQALCIIGYLKSHPKREMVFYPAHPDINENCSRYCDWE